MAEVKVRVTAQNETRTGLQQALSDAKQFGQEATRSVTIDEQAAMAPIRKMQAALADASKASGPQLSEQQSVAVAAENEAALAPLREIQAKLREIREQAGQPIQAPAIDTSSQEQLASANVRGAAAIRGLATDLANASGPAQIFEAVIRRISTAFGGLIAATAGFAIGSIIAKTLREAAAGVEDLANKSQALQTSFANLSAPTTSFDQLSSAIRGAADEIKALQDANQKLQSGIGFQLADYASSFDLSTAANQATESGVNSARINLASAISAAASRELELAQARTDEERKLISLQSARQDLLNQGRAADAASGGAPRGGRLSVEGELARLFAAQDASGAAQAEASLQAQADKQRAINEDNRRSLEERLAKEKEIQNALAGVEGAKAELEREQSLARSEALAAQIASNNERAADAAEAEEKARQRLAQQAADLTRANEERNLDPSTLLARRQADLAGVRDEDFDNTSEADIRRQQITAEILRLEDAITAEQERQAAAQESAQKAITDLRRLGQSPAERRAAIEQETTDLLGRARSLAPDDFAGAQEVAAEAGRISSELRGLEPGEFGGASDLQRVGLASREFFNTADDKTEKAVNRANDLVKRVVTILENSDGLYIGRN